MTRRRRPGSTRAIAGGIDLHHGLDRGSYPAAQRDILGQHFFCALKRELGAVDALPGIGNFRRQNIGRHSLSVECVHHGLETHGGAVRSQMSGTASARERIIRGARVTISEASRAPTAGLHGCAKASEIEFSAEEKGAAFRSALLMPREPIHGRVCFGQRGQRLFDFLCRNVRALDVPHNLLPQQREPCGAICVAVSRSFKVEGRKPHGRRFQLSSSRIRGSAFRSDVRRYVAKGWPEGREE